MSEVTQANEAGVIQNRCPLGEQFQSRSMNCVCVPTHTQADMLFCLFYLKYLKKGYFLLRYS